MKAALYHIYRVRNNALRERLCPEYVCVWDQVRAKSSLHSNFGRTTSRYSHIFSGCIDSGHAVIILKPQLFLDILVLS